MYRVNTFVCAVIQFYDAGSDDYTNLSKVLASFGNTQRTLKNFFRAVQEGGLPMQIRAVEWVEKNTGKKIFDISSLQEKKQEHQQPKETQDKIVEELITLKAMIGNLKDNVEDVAVAVASSDLRTQHVLEHII